MYELLLSLGYDVYSRAIMFYVFIVDTQNRSWFVRTLRTKKTERTLRIKKPKAHFYFQRSSIKLQYTY